MNSLFRTTYGLMSLKSIQLFLQIREYTEIDIMDDIVFEDITVFDLLNI